MGGDKNGGKTLGDLDPLHCIIYNLANLMAKCIFTDESDENNGWRAIEWRHIRVFYIRTLSYGTYTLGPHTARLGNHLRPDLRSP